MIRRVAVFLLVSIAAAAQCKTARVAAPQLASAPSPIQELASDLAHPGVSVAQVTTKRFGQPVRRTEDSIEWRAPGGTLTFAAGRLKYQSESGPQISLIDDPTTIFKVLSRDFQWEEDDQKPPRLSTLRFKGAEYDFSQNAAKLDGKDAEFFLAHPKGTYVIQFEPFCVPVTILEMLPDGTKIGSVILNPSGGAKPETLRIESSDSGKALLLIGKKDVRFKSQAKQ